MPQTLLPLFPAEAIPVNELISFCKRDGTVYYFHDALPVFSHAESDLKAFRNNRGRYPVLITSLVSANSVQRKTSQHPQFPICPISTDAGSAGAHFAGSILNSMGVAFLLTLPNTRWSISHTF